jgi:hypothetical protein
METDDGTQEPLTTTSSIVDLLERRESLRARPAIVEMFIFDRLMNVQIVELRLAGTSVHGEAHSAE